MATGFAEDMNRDAVEIGRLMEKETKGKLGWKRHPYRQDNVKTWYNRPEAFESRADRVFLGIHPAGDPFDPKAPAGHCCKRQDWHDDDGHYSYWICEDWSHAKNGTRHQGYVLKAFRLIYGKGGKGLLHATPSFNVCPIRTSEVKDIPMPVWRRSVSWAKTVLDEVEPSTIICNGNAESGRSPWAMLKREYGLQYTKYYALGDTNRSLKFGVAKDKPLNGTKVLALPHLSYHGGWSSLHELLQHAKCKFELD